MIQMLKPITSFEKSSSTYTLFVLGIPPLDISNVVPAKTSGYNITNGYKYYHNNSILLHFCINCLSGIAHCSRKVFKADDFKKNFDLLNLFSNRVGNRRALILVATKAASDLNFIKLNVFCTFRNFFDIKKLENKT